MIQRLVAYLRGWPAYRWVVLMAAIYFVAAFYGTWVNYIDLHFTTLGIYDLSINQQALASTAHGNYPYPFYEASNCGRNERCSFLQVHPIFLAYLVVIPYSLAPTPATLFAIQDLALGLAALPLYLLTREITKSTRLAVLTSAIFLVWLPAFSGVFSFHWEAFLPLEIFSLFYLWLREKYLLSIPIAILTYVTLEIGSVFLFCVALFFLVPWAELFVGYLRARWRLRTVPLGPRRTSLSAALHRVWSGMFRPPRVRAAFALMIGSVVAYVTLHEFVTRGGWLLGLPPLPAMYQIPLSQPVYAATFTLGNFLYHWPQKLIFWLVMFGTLAAIPLLAPRTVILWGPWVAYTTVTTSGFYHMGNQYAFLAAAVMFPGFIYGLVRLQRWANGTHFGTPWQRFWNGGDPLPVVPTAAVGTGSAFARALDTIDRVILSRQSPGASNPSPATGSSARRPVVGVPRRPKEIRPVPAWKLERQRRRSWQIIGVVATGIVVFNLALNPLIPSTAFLRADRPFAAQSNLGLTGLPNYTSYAQVMSLIDLIPSRAVVAVSPALLTLLANNPHAYPLLNDVNWPVFPFNASQPQYVLLVVHGSTYVPRWLQVDQLYTTGNLTVRAWAPSTYLGGMILFERNYSGPVETFGQDPNYLGSAFSALSGIVVHPAGMVVTDPSVPFGTIVTTSRVVNGAHHLVSAVGRIVQTPVIDLAAGSYMVTVNLTGVATAKPPKDAAITNVSEIHLAAFEYPVGHVQLNYSEMSQPEWITVTIIQPLSGPVLNFQAIVTNEVSWFSTSVYSITITPMG